ncbi:SDR family NAD(P)-dependent oxidoreductase [Teredinibacter turnerae]|uniref:SDR family NAD(P)-dependent oxidoreductase n=1 Tax=Teredinibacter turnerae TaxID=2426 RepID=UPI0005F76B6E|nr:SDR family NAD(P)-dependent oxidoreductase [Teredinibacter turnerae]
MNSLHEIYEMLSAGEISQDHAINAIRTLKQHGNESRMFLAQPLWSEAPMAKAGAGYGHVYAKRLVLACSSVLNDVEAGSPNHSCRVFDDECLNDIAGLYSLFSTFCYGELKRIIKEKPNKPMLVQVLAPADGANEIYLGLSALLKTAHKECPFIFGQLILLDISKHKINDENFIGYDSLSLLDEEAAYGHDVIAKYVAYKRYTYIWQEYESSGSEVYPFPLMENGVYLITGGLGGLGQILTKSFFEKCPTVRVILCGRSDLPKDSKRLLDSFAKNSQSISYRRVDICDQDEVQSFLYKIEQEYGGINGVLHCAGIVNDNFIINKSEQEFSDVLTPKVQGTYFLDRASINLKLDFFALFSSGAAVVGNVGQADYAAANGFMDAYSCYRNNLVNRGLRTGKTLSFNWPLWKSGGMRLDQEYQKQLSRLTGMQMMNAEDGLDIFYRGLISNAHQLLIVAGRRQEIKNKLVLKDINRLPVFKPDHFSQLDVDSNGEPGEFKEIDINRIEKSDELKKSTVLFLRDLLASVLKIDVSEVSLAVPFDRYGIDSILALKLISALEDVFGSLPKTLFFEYSTLAELAEYFMDGYSNKLLRLFSDFDKYSIKAGKPSARRIDHPSAKILTTVKNLKSLTLQNILASKQKNHGREFLAQQIPRIEHFAYKPASIAIIGLSGRYPESGDISSYWSNLASGRDCIREVPLSRWDWRDYYSEDRSQGGSHYSKWGGFIDGVDEFDPRFFNISPKEAVTLDPQERLFLQHAWMAVEDAGYTRARLQVAHGERQAGQVGVYVGVMYNEYQLLGAESSLRGQRMGFASTPASIANRVSYVLNVHGPSMTVDTMCSSSLTAIHLACQDLRIGRTDLALAGGVNVTIHPNKYLMLSAGQFISSDGHCQSFGEGGDGYIPGEGVGAVLLKPLAQAEADGDPIHGVIRGSALNHGGRTNGYSVPNPKAQACAIAQALDDAQVDPRHISYLEAHGTGTQLGDPVEIAGLSKAFYRGVAEAEQARGYCRLGSAKSNIGHGEAAAGIAGLTKILLQMRHRQIVPSLHSQRLNPNIDFAETPFIVNQTLTAWEAPVVDGREQPRLAGLSSFGAGGANAHMIVEEYPALAAEIESEAISATPTIVPLSARTAEQLQDKAQDLLTFIEASPATELAALAYTCQVGRDAMDERLCVVVDSIAQLRASLQAYCAGKADVEGVYQGQVKAHRERVSALSQDDDMQGTLAHWLADRKLGPLADLWVKGLTIDWSALYAGQVPRRLHLPTYPFARERYWIETDTTALPLVTGAMHPLLQRNTSTLQQHSYHSEFKGTEFFYTPGESRMPEAVYLAMARAAVEHGLASAGESEVIELFDLAWGIPAHARGLSIALFNLVVDRDNTAQVDFEIYSQVDKQEAIDSTHCQGRARRGQRVLPPAVDLGAIQARCQPLALTTAPAHVTALYHEGSQLMATLTLPELMHGSLEQYPLHPQILQGALATVADWLVAQGMAPAGLLPQSLSSLTLYFACCENMVLWARYTGRNETALQVDISVCDAQGRVYLQLHGLSYALPATTTALSSADVVDELATDAEGAQVSKAPITVPTRIEIALPRSTSPEAVVSVLAKPQGIPLVAVEDVRDLAPAPLVHPTIPLAAPSSQWPVGAPRTPAVDDVYLEDLGQGIYRLTLQSSTPTAALMDTLDHALDVLGARENVKVLLFCGHGNAPLQGDRRNPQWLGLCQRISALPQPTLAVLPGGAEGAGLLLGAVCDVMICSEQAPYGLGDALAPSAGDQAFWEGRFGAALAAEILWTTARASGQDWQRKGLTCPILASDAIEAYALAWATHLAGKSVEALQQLKPHLTQARQGWITALAATPAERALSAPPSEPPSPATLSGEGLQVSVVGHTLQVTLADTRPPHALTGLGAVLAQGASAGYRSVVLSGALFAGADEATPSAEIATLIHSLLGSPLWIVAALEGDARGLAWLLAQCCDSVIHSTEGVYGIDALWHQGPWASWAVVVLDQRLGQSLSQRLMLSPDGLSGHELPRIAHWHVTSSDAVTVEAQQVASTWAERQPHADWQQALATWKGAREQAITHAQTTLSAMSTEDDVAEATRDQGIPAQDGQTIPLQSPVIEVVAYPQGIVHIRMVDRAAKNLFSPAFVAGMDEAFAHIRDHGQYKVVVLSGYDQYFASGGTKDTLLAIQRGEAQFTDITVYQRPLDCDLPVVAAMQGHAIGAGWALGMFADVVLFSDESHYVSPYMNYGFTPGAGSTTLLPYKLGQDLAFDSLLSGQPFDGRALHARGLPYPVLPRHRLEMTAHQWAGQLAQASRAQLMALKDYWRQGIAPALAETYAQELAMHEATFVGQDATLAQIQAQFGAGEASEQPAVPTAAPAAPARAASAQSVLSTLKTLLAKELHMGSDELDQDEQFVDLGLDSITGVTWVRAINAQYQLDIEATKVYSYPTLQAFSRYVSEIVAEQAPVSEPEEPTPAALEAPSPSTATAIGAPRAWSDVSAQVLTSWRHALPSVASSARPPEAIAIVGMAGQFASTNSLADYWRAIAAGEDCIREVSAERWSIDQYYQPGETPAAGKTNSKWLGGLTHYDGFDPLFFNLSPKEAMSMDPQQRVFLQACWNSIEDAGYQAQSLSGSRCGVFVGCASAGYQLLSRELQLSAQGFTGEASSILAARIAYYLNLQGPCLSIDTACSSSLVAIAQACDSLRHGDSDMALAGGVYVMSGPELHIKSAQAGMLSPDGRCFTFDQRANGFVPGEGVGVVMLKRLSDAERDGDSIHAVLRGWGVNQDGKTNGITAPSAQSQTRLQRSIYDKFAIDPTNIQLVEAHGTGTPLGDPIEVEGLRHAFGAYTDKTDYCALGSVKSNIGHCLAAAGIAGVLKVVLALKHRQLPPTLHVQQVNEHIGLSGSPFYINDRLRSWDVGNGQSRQGAVSSFGFSGTNAHVVVAEAPATSSQQPARSDTPRGPVVIPLSAKTPEQLNQRMQDLIGFLDQTNHKTLSLSRLAYTLQTGRDAMDERLCLVANSVNQLRSQLQITWEAASQDHPDYTVLEDQGIYRASVKSHRQGIDFLSQDPQIQATLLAQWRANNQLTTIAQMWSKGLAIDWQMLNDNAYQRMHLPSYPFSNERFWVPANVTTEVPTDVTDVETGQARKTLPETLLFEEVWKPFNSKEKKPATNTRQFVIFADETLRSSLVDSDFPEFNGAIYIERGEQYRKIDEQLFSCRFNQEEDIVQLVRNVSQTTNRPLTLIYTWAKGQGLEGVNALLGLFKAIRREGDQVAHACLVGRYAENDINACWDYSWISFEQSLKYDIGAKVSVLFHDEGWGRPEDYLQATARAGALRFKGAQAYSLSVNPVSLNPEHNRDTSVIQQGGRFLITGGIGELGRLFAHYLAKQYNARLHLVGRRGRSDDISKTLAQLKEAGALEVEYSSVDLTCENSVKAWVRELSYDFEGIIHCAGVQSYGPFETMTPEEFNRAVYAKSKSLQFLDQYLCLERLDFACYFSSSAAILGDSGNCAYSIANRFQMGYGIYRRFSCYPGETLVVNWPLWRDGGMGHSHQTDLYLKSSGQVFLESTLGLRIWDELLTAKQKQVLLLIGDASKLTATVNRVYEPHQDLHPQYSETVNDITLAELLINDITDLVSRHVHLPVTKLDHNRILSDYGFDSIELAKFATVLTEYFGVIVTPALFFSYATIAQLRDFYLEQHRDLLKNRYTSKAHDTTFDESSLLNIAHFPEQSAQRRASDSPPNEYSDKPKSVAIIGMSGRFPGCKNVEEFWELLENQKDAISEIPESRWDWRNYFSQEKSSANKISTNKGGFIQGIDRFDPLFFEISPREAEEMDPAERLLLMESYRAIEDAGLNPLELKGSDTGVFVGMEESQYGLLTKNQGVTTGGSAMISSRLSYFLDLHGPTIAINTACSSGLVALHQAAMSLQTDECDTALVAGLSLSLSPLSFEKMSQAGMLSPEGRCASFSSGANGIVVSEAVVVVVLKPLFRAVEDGDPIYASICGSGINFDGKTNGVTAPNARMQSNLIEKVYRKNNIRVDHVSHVIAHGTGTKLGDPVEYNALCDAFSRVSQEQGVSLPKQSCAITSCKSNVGHTMAASGLVSIVSLLLGLKHGKIPASLYCEDESAYINATDSPFFINKKTRIWERSKSERLASVSSFGRSGTNAHVVIQEYIPRKTLKTTFLPKKYLVPLSARTSEALKQRALDLLSFLEGISKTGESQISSIAMADIAYTLQLGREHMQERVGFSVSDVYELKERLRNFVHGPSDVDATRLIPVDEAHSQMQNWLAGENINWLDLYLQATPRKLHLPTYPFSNKRYWFQNDTADSVFNNENTEWNHAINIEEIESLIGRIEEEHMETSKATELLQELI